MDKFDVFGLVEAYVFSFFAFVLVVLNTKAAVETRKTAGKKNVVSLVTSYVLGGLAIILVILATYCLIVGC